MMAEMLAIDEETLQDIINMETGLLYPLKGFMNNKDYRSVVDNYNSAGMSACRCFCCREAV
ncbi:MAG: hypothetical protein K1W41_15130 [Lachnospiraceae bacterium]